MNITEADKIDIEGITNNVRYEHMALLVDREDFILSVKSIRKSIGITNLLRYKEVDTWLHRGYKNSSLSQMENKDKETFNQIFRLSLSVSNLKNEFHKNINYTDAIKYAILAGKITDKEFSITSFCAEFPFSQEFEDAEFTAEQPMVAIFVNPETKIDEVVRLFNSEVKEMFREIDKNVTMIPRESPTFKDARNWYWQKKSMTFDMLYKKYANGTSYEAIKRSVERYSKKLQGDI